MFKLGVMLGNYGLTTEAALEHAVAAGLQGVQLSGTRAEFAPANIPAHKRHELLDMVKSRGLVFSAVCGEQMYGFANRVRNAQLVDNTRRIIDMALELESNIVTTHIGVIPEDEHTERYSAMHDACYEMAEYAARNGTRFAIETGPEPASVLRAFLDNLNSKGIAVNLDPANLVMMAGDNPIKAVYTLGDYIVHTHAKDGRQLMKGDIDHLYATAQAEQYHGTYLVETLLGRGDVHYPEYLRALADIGYGGFLTIERECDATPVEDISYAAGYLHALLETL